MTDNMFDKFVRDKLRDHPSAVPSGLWEKIERKKDTKPKGGFFGRTAFWAGLFVVTTMGIGYVFMQDSQKTAATAELGKTATPTKNSDETRQDAVITAGDNNTPSTSTASGSNVKTQDNTTTINNNTGTEVYGTTRNNVLSANTQSAILTNQQNHKALSIKTPTGNSDTKHLQPNNAIIPHYTQTVDAPSGNRIAFIKGSTAYNFFKTGNFSTSKQYNVSEIKIVGIDCPPNGWQGRNDWYLEVYASPDISMKSVEAPANSSYVSKKDSTEKQQLGYTAGFRISKSISENLLLKTGLQYSQINERFMLRTENERRIITVVTIRTVTGSSGADSTIRDTTSLEQIGYRVQKSYNRYRSIDIPLLLSYEFGSDNLKFAINAGAIFNLYSWYSGNTLNDSLAVVSLNSKSSGIYKQNIGVGLYGGLSIMKPIGRKLDFFAEPYFRYNLSNMTKQPGYTQRFNAAGINIGIRYKLKGQRSGVK